MDFLCLYDFCAPIRNVPHLVYNIGIEFAFVAYQENCTLEFFYGTGKLFLCHNVEMVGRLVQNKDVCRVLHHLAKAYLCVLAA